MLSAEEDGLSAIMTINPGAGGTEGQDCRYANANVFMYRRENNYKSKIIDIQKGEPVGIKSVTIEIDGDFAFDKGENGVHRLVKFLLLTRIQNVIQHLHLFCISTCK